MVPTYSGCPIPARRVGRQARVRSADRFNRFNRRESVVEQTEISAEEWEACCAGFSRAHRGWLIGLATIATVQLQAEPERVEAHWQVVVDQVRFQDLVLGPAPGTCGIVTQSQTGAAIVEHRVKGLVRLFRLTLDGVHQGLRIDNINAGKEQSTLIWLRSSDAFEASSVSRTIDV
jgi:hypothetical protein